MQTRNLLNRLSFLGSLTLLLAAGMVGCSSPVATPDDAVATPLSKGGKQTTTTIVWETEPNDDPALASDVVTFASGFRMGYVSAATDNDYFPTQSLLPGQWMTVNLSMPYQMDYDVQILANDGVTVLASNHMGAGFGETLLLQNTATSSQSYIVRVFSADGSSTTTSPYTLTVGLVNVRTRGKG
jgi:hypothetical protein